MKSLKKRMIVALLLLALFVLTPSLAAAQGGSLIPGLSPAKGSNDIGIVFSASDLFLDLQSYQGGLGAKMGWGKYSLRGLLDFSADSAMRAYGVSVGVTAEYHLVPGPISPYLGASAGTGYVTQAAVSSVLSFSVEAVAGVEVFIADFLSVFAEYALGASFTSTTDLTTSQNTFDYMISTGMGNKAKLGIVIYFMRSDVKVK